MHFHTKHILQRPPDAQSLQILARSRRHHSARVKSPSMIFPYKTPLLLLIGSLSLIPPTDYLITGIRWACRARHRSGESSFTKLLAVLIPALLVTLIRSLHLHGLVHSLWEPISSAHLPHVRWHSALHTGLAHLHAQIRKPRMVQGILCRDPQLGP